MSIRAMVVDDQALVPTVPGGYRLAARVTVAGFISIVTSALFKTSNSERTASRIFATCIGFKSDGVPPPKKIVSAGARSPACRISFRTAPTYCVFCP